MAALPDPFENSVASSLTGVELSNIYSLIDRQNVHGLNLAVPEDAQAVIKPWNEREDTTVYVDSGVDDQMIIHIPFVESVRLKSITLKVGTGEHAPRNLRIYANHPTIVDFSEAENTKPNLDMRLLEGETKVVEYPLRVAAFARVTSVSLLFSNAPSEEMSRVYFIGFKGESKFQRKELGTKLEVPAPNAASKPLVDKATEKNAARQGWAR